jgi:hypothetical protein
MQGTNALTYLNVHWRKRKLSAGVNDSKLFSSLLMLRQNKLERSSLASFFGKSSTF